MLNCTTFIRLAAAAALALAAPAHALTYTFDTDAQGWTSTGTSIAGFVGALGNPGGLFGMTDGGPGNMAASVSFAGQNLSSALGGTLSFDYSHVSLLHAPSDNAALGTVTLFGSGTSVSSDLIPASVTPNVWHTFSAPLSGGGWAGPGTLNTVLADLTGIRIVTDARISGLGSHIEAVGIDNVTIAAVPEPHEWAMMLAGLGLVGWVARRRGRAYPCLSSQPR